eukprot:gene3877-366_t
MSGKANLGMRGGGPPHCIGTVDGGTSTTAGLERLGPQRNLWGPGLP